MTEFSWTSFILGAAAFRLGIYVFRSVRTELGDAACPICGQKS